uniref:ATP synthase subunit a n=1 Tax=Aleyrodes shizuokensis TaxID=860392 RepID=A0A7T1NM24_9HEMI|nr:ATP synthase F0 subunit 6 [Aleyrodes shizuokensis]QPO06176.1 ATP synthase F0 subunit 6 [Aleyrodes shizuokensis]
MMSSLFEVYDPHTFFLSLSLNWIILIFIFFVFFSNFWVSLNNVNYFMVTTIKGLLGEYNNFFSVNKMVKGGVILFINMFIYLLMINLLGLIPYTFSCSSHFVFAVSLSLPLWLGMISIGWLKFTNSMFSHLVPLGTPLVLIPLMVFIESSSNLIRPWSLSVRLMSNMISGHLLMSLLGNCTMYIFFIQLMFFMFEFFVCFIQAYVFSTLLTLYSSEI